MSSKVNPELKVGDEVVLLRMVDEPRMRSGLKGIVETVNSTPWGPQYSVKWENGSSLDLIPGSDKWMLKNEMFKESVSESQNVKNLFDNKLFLKYVDDKEDVFEFLSLLQDSGLINMMGAGTFLTYTSDNMRDYIIGQFKDPDDYEELIDKAGESRDALIRGVMNMYEGEGKSLEDMNKVNRDFKKICDLAMSLYFKNYNTFIKKS